MQKKLIALCVVGLLLVPAVLCARTKDIIDQKAALAWKDIQNPQGMWKYDITPPFPATWPVDQNNVIYYYLYARSVVPADAPKVSAPWGRVALHQDGTFVVEMLTKELKEIGAQRVSAMSNPDMSLFKKAEMLEGVLIKLTDQPAASAIAQSANVVEMKQYYCAWSSLNDVIAGKIKALHPTFFTWLACGK
jgi:hypothetical protein